MPFGSRSFHFSGYLFLRQRRFTGCGQIFGYRSNARKRAAPNFRLQDGFQGSGFKQT
jgi:hypothetical protein